MFAVGKGTPKDDKSLDVSRRDMEEVKKYSNWGISYVVGPSYWFPSTSGKHCVTRTARSSSFFCVATGGNTTPIRDWK